MGSCGRYSSDQSILLVGDGDMSFSLALAKAFERARAKQSAAKNLVVTTLDSEGWLQAHYANALRHAAELRECGAQVHHNIDARALELHDVVVRAAPFHCVVFNFPHPGWPTELSRKKRGLKYGNEGFEVMIERHRTLLRGFFRSVLALAKRAGQRDLEVHVTSKDRSKGRGDRWQVAALASDCGLELVYECPFGGQTYDAFGYVHKHGVLKGDAGEWDVDAKFPRCRAITRVFRPRKALSLRIQGLDNSEDGSSGTSDSLAVEEDSDSPSGSGSTVRLDSMGTDGSECDNDKLDGNDAKRQKVL